MIKLFSWKSVNRSWFFQKKKVEIHSIVLICTYLIILVLGVFCFYCWNKVPTRVFEFQGEIIKGDIPLKYFEKSKSYTLPHLSLTVSIPMTMQKNLHQKDRYGKVDISIEPIWKSLETDTTFMDSYAFAKQYQPDSLTNVIDKNIQNLYIYSINDTIIQKDNKHKKDSILNAVMSDKRIISSCKNNIYYVSFLQKTNEGFWLSFTPKNEFNHWGSPLSEKRKCYSFLKCTGAADSIFTENIFCSGLSTLVANNNQLHGALATPTWINLSDISQGYYIIKLKSYTFDDFTFTLDFKSATNFSVLDPLPDKHTLSAITYTNPEKIRQIKEKGLSFHASFPEMQNKQAVRTFALTTFMTLIISMLLKDLLFVVLGLLKRK